MLGHDPIQAAPGNLSCCQKQRVDLQAVRVGLSPVCPHHRVSDIPVRVMPRRQVGMALPHTHSHTLALKSPRHTPGQALRGIGAATVGAVVTRWG